VSAGKGSAKGPFPPGGSHERGRGRQRWQVLIQGRRSRPSYQVTETTKMTGPVVATVPLHGARGMKNCCGRQDARPLAGPGRETHDRGMHIDQCRFGTLVVDGREIHGDVLVTPSRAQERRIAPDLLRMPGPLSLGRQRSSEVIVTVGGDVDNSTGRGVALSRTRHPWCAGFECIGTSRRWPGRAACGTRCAGRSRLPEKLARPAGATPVDVT
jgi:hypothetical protein